ncbi:hypothetical protein BESB_021880 [Besnoitia besnoiti]|uniref:Uncharacterized protein n=1 Tax=Besnoitia besnoiti TaxID=94643 RepID=A0A2A9M9G0_BESBE|nr:hypothetical protein BESB_021880 [Besnoitia besnoiti]PFH32247.1 hypothetical protein BESB_021880 [Besnoitia besnoiti]
MVLRLRPRGRPPRSAAEKRRQQKREPGAQECLPFRRPPRRRQRSDAQSQSPSFASEACRASGGVYANLQGGDETRPAESSATALCVSPLFLRSSRNSSSFSSSPSSPVSPRASPRASLARLSPPSSAVASGSAPASVEGLCRGAASVSVFQSPFSSLAFRTRLPSCFAAALLERAAAALSPAASAPWRRAQTRAFASAVGERPLSAGAADSLSLRGKKGDPDGRNLGEATSSVGLAPASAPPTTASSLGVSTPPAGLDGTPPPALGDDLEEAIRRLYRLRTSVFARASCAVRRRPPLGCAPSQREAIFGCLLHQAPTLTQLLVELRTALLKAERCLLFGAARPPAPPSPASVPARPSPAAASSPPDPHPTVPAAGAFSVSSSSSAETAQRPPLDSPRQLSSRHPGCVSAAEGAPPVGDSAGALHVARRQLWCDLARVASVLTTLGKSLPLPPSAAADAGGERFAPADLEQALDELLARLAHVLPAAAEAVAAEGDGERRPCRVDQARSSSEAAASSVRGGAGLDVPSAAAAPNRGDALGAAPRVRALHDLTLAYAQLVTSVLAVASRAPAVDADASLAAALHAVAWFARLLPCPTAAASPAAQPAEFPAAPLALLLSPWAPGASARQLLPLFSSAPMAGAIQEFLQAARAGLPALVAAAQASVPRLSDARLTDLVWAITSLKDFLCSSGGREGPQHCASAGAAAAGLHEHEAFVNDLPAASAGAKSLQEALPASCAALAAHAPVSGFSPEAFLQAAARRSAELGESSAPERTVALLRAACVFSSFPRALFARFSASILDAEAAENPARVQSLPLAAPRAADAPPATQESSAAPHLQRSAAPHSGEEPVRGGGRGRLLEAAGPAATSALLWAYARFLTSASPGSAELAPEAARLHRAAFYAALGYELAQLRRQPWRHRDCAKAAGLLSQAWTARAVCSSCWAASRVLEVTPASEGVWRRLAATFVREALVACVPPSRGAPTGGLGLDFKLTGGPFLDLMNLLEACSRCRVVSLPLLDFVAEGLARREEALGSSGARRRESGFADCPPRADVQGVYSAREVSAAVALLAMLSRHYSFALEHRAEVVRRRQRAPCRERGARGASLEATAEARRGADSGVATADAAVARIDEGRRRLVRLLLGHLHVVRGSDLPNLLWALASCRHQDRISSAAGACVRPRSHLPSGAAHGAAPASTHVLEARRDDADARGSAEADSSACREETQLLGRVLVRLRDQRRVYAPAHVSRLVWSLTRPELLHAAAAEGVPPSVVGGLLDALLLSLLPPPAPHASSPAAAWAGERQVGLVARAGPLPRGGAAGGDADWEPGRESASLPLLSTLGLERLCNVLASYPSFRDAEYASVKARFVSEAVDELLRLFCLVAARHAAAQARESSAAARDREPPLLLGHIRCPAVHLPAASPALPQLLAEAARLETLAGVVWALQAVNRRHALLVALVMQQATGALRRLTELQWAAAGGGGDGSGGETRREVGCVSPSSAPGTEAADLPPPPPAWSVSRLLMTCLAACSKLRCELAPEFFHACARYMAGLRGFVAQALPTHAEPGGGGGGGAGAGARGGERPRSADLQTALQVQDILAAEGWSVWTLANFLSASTACGGTDPRVLAPVSSLLALALFGRDVTACAAEARSRAQRDAESDAAARESFSRTERCAAAAACGCEPADSERAEATEAAEAAGSREPLLPVLLAAQSSDIPRSMALLLASLARARCAADNPLFPLLLRVAAELTAKELVAAQVWTAREREELAAGRADAKPLLLRLTQLGEPSIESCLSSTWSSSVYSSFLDFVVASAGTEEEAAAARRGGASAPFSAAPPAPGSRGASPGSPPPCLLAAHAHLLTGEHSPTPSLPASLAALERACVSAAASLGVAPFILEVWRVLGPLATVPLQSALQRRARCALESLLDTSQVDVFEETLLPPPLTAFVDILLVHRASQRALVVEIEGPSHFSCCVRAPRPAPGQPSTTGALGRREAPGGGAPTGAAADRVEALEGGAAWTTKEIYLSAPGGELSAPVAYSYDAKTRQKRARLHAAGVACLYLPFYAFPPWQSSSALLSFLRAALPPEWLRQAGSAPALAPRVTGGTSPAEKPREATWMQRTPGYRVAARPLGGLRLETLLCRAEGGGSRASVGASGVAESLANSGRGTLAGKAPLDAQRVRGRNFTPSLRQSLPPLGACLEASGGARPAAPFWRRFSALARVSSTTESATCGVKASRRSAVADDAEEAGADTVRSAPSHSAGWRDDAGEGSSGASSSSAAPSHVADSPPACLPAESPLPWWLGEEAERRARASLAAGSLPRLAFAEEGAVEDRGDAGARWSGAAVCSASLRLSPADEEFLLQQATRSFRSPARERRARAAARAREAASPGSSAAATSALPEESAGGEPTSEAGEDHLLELPPLDKSLLPRALAFQKRLEALFASPRRFSLHLQWLHALATERQLHLERLGYPQPQLQLHPRARAGGDGEDEDEGARAAPPAGARPGEPHAWSQASRPFFLLTHQPMIYVVLSVADPRLWLWAACPPNQAPAFHFLHLLDEAAAPLDLAPRPPATKSPREATSAARERRETLEPQFVADCRFEGFVVGQTLHSGRYGHQRVAQLLAKWRREQGARGESLVLYPLERLPCEHRRAPFHALAEDRLQVWKQLLTPTTLGATRGGGMTRAERTKQGSGLARLLLPPPRRPQSWEEPEDGESAAPGEQAGVPSCSRGNEENAARADAAALLGCNSGGVERGCFLLKGNGL